MELLVGRAVLPQVLRSLFPGLFWLLVAASFPWLVAPSLPSSRTAPSNRSLFSFRITSPLCVWVSNFHLPISYKDTHGCMQGPPGAITWSPTGNHVGPQGKSRGTPGEITWAPRGNHVGPHGQSRGRRRGPCGSPLLPRRGGSTSRPARHSAAGPGRRPRPGRSTCRPDCTLLLTSGLVVGLMSSPGSSWPRWAEPPGGPAL